MPLNETSLDDQRSILRFLAERVDTGDKRYCTIRTIREGAGLTGTDEYLRAIADDLEIGGYINTRQMYNMEGGRLFQISARGSDLIDTGEDPFADRPDRVTIHSASWTGRILTNAEREELLENIADALDKIETLKLPNEKKAQARAYLLGAKELAGAPDPPFDLIVFLLGNVDRLIGIAGLFVGLAGLMVSLVK